MSNTINQYKEMTIRKVIHIVINNTVQCTRVEISDPELLKKHEYLRPIGAMEECYKYCTRCMTKLFGDYIDWGGMKSGGNRRN